MAHRALRMAVWLVLVSGGVVLLISGAVEASAALDAQFHATRYQADGPRGCPLGQRLTSRYVVDLRSWEVDCGRE